VHVSTSRPWSTLLRQTLSPFVGSAAACGAPPKISAPVLNPATKSPMARDQDIPSMTHSRFVGYVFEDTLRGLSLGAHA
jgi:hypothetical protein